MIVMLLEFYLGCDKIWHQVASASCLHHFLLTLDADGSGRPSSLSSDERITNITLMVKWYQRLAVKTDYSCKLLKCKFGFSNNSPLVFSCCFS